MHKKFGNEFISCRVLDDNTMRNSIRDRVSKKDLYYSSNVYFSVPRKADSVGDD